MKETGDKLASLLFNDHHNLIFLHNTKKKEVAEQIMQDGFQFENQLTYSTDRVSARDAIEISYFLVERKDYGHFTIIIEIDRKVFMRYSKLAETSDLHFEDLLTITIPELSDNDEFIYTLSPHYIKCYFNNKTGEVVENPIFDPLHESDIYLENHSRLKGE